MAEFALAYAPVKNFEGGWCDDFGDKGRGNLLRLRPELFSRRTDLAGHRS